MNQAQLSAMPADDVVADFTAHQGALQLALMPSGTAPLGANIHADLAASDWRFLLPRLHYGVLLFVGVPPIASIRVLSAMAQSVIIVHTSATMREQLLREIETRALTNVWLVTADSAAGLPVRDGAVELLVADSGADTSRLLRARDWVRELNRVLTSDGVVYLETAGALDAARITQQVGRLHQHGFARPARFRAVRRNGSLRLVLPQGQEATARFCVDHLISGTSRNSRQLRQVARVLVRMGLLDHAVRRQIVLLERGRDRTLAAAYAHTSADTHAAQVVFFSRSEFNANKIMLLVSDPQGAPRVVVKIPRSPLYNDRLEQEHEALTALRAGGFAEPGSYPDSLFLRHHHGLALHGQTALTGSAFRNVSSARADCVYAREVIEWLTRLGEASAERVPSDDVAHDLSALVARFTAIYPVTDSESAFLGAQVEALRRARDLPLVFQHGDATTWNIVTRAGGGIAMLDWEHGARFGMPLWDLFDFMQSFGGWAARIHGSGDTPLTRATTFVDTSPVNALCINAVRSYCQRVGVSRELIEPLFYLCWLQRALRTVAGGTHPDETVPFFQLLRCCVAGRDRAGLTCLFE